MKSKTPNGKRSGFDTRKTETGGYREEFRVGPVSRIWLPTLADIDASWNSSPWSEAAFDIELSNSAARLRGIYTKDELIGYLVAHVVIDSAHIVSIAVAVPWRHQGVGAVLLGHFLDESEASGVSVITLEVRASNNPAQRLYEKLGFESVGVRHKYYTNDNEDAVIMRRVSPTA